MEMGGVGGCNSCWHPNWKGRKELIGERSSLHYSSPEEGGRRRGEAATEVDSENIRERAATQHSHQTPSIHHLPPSVGCHCFISMTIHYVCARAHAQTGLWRVSVCVGGGGACLIGLFLLIILNFSSATVHNSCSVKDIKHLTNWVMQINPQRALMFTKHGTRQCVCDLHPPIFRILLVPIGAAEKLVRLVHLHLSGSGSKDVCTAKKNKKEEAGLRRSICQ